MQALSKDPKQRFPSVVTFSSQLRDVLLAGGSNAAGGGILSRVKSIFKM